MKTYNAEGIGQLELNQTANVLSLLLKVLRIPFLIVGGLLGLLVVMAMRDRETPPIWASITAMVCFLVGFALLALQYLAIRRLYYPGDWYKELERFAAKEEHGDAMEAAQALLKLTGTDTVTCKVRAKAHLYLAYHLNAEAGAGHWGPLIKLLNPILDQEPDNASFRLDRAQAYQHVEKYDEALQDLEIPIADTDRPSLRAHSIKISCLTSTNRLQDAQRACDELERLTCRFPNQNDVAQGVAAHRAELQKSRSGEGALSDPEVREVLKDPAVREAWAATWKGWREGLSTKLAQTEAEKTSVDSFIDKYIAKYGRLLQLVVTRRPLDMGEFFIAIISKPNADVFVLTNKTLYHFAKDDTIPITDNTLYHLSKDDTIPEQAHVIPLTEIESYRFGGLVEGRVQIKLRSGEVIDRRTAWGIDEKVVKRFMESAGVPDA